MQETKTLDYRNEGVTWKNWLTVLVAGLAIFMSTADMSAVNAVLPTIGASFQVMPALSEWVLLSYSLAIVALLPLAGRIADRSNRKQFYIASLSAFVAASVLCGLATSIWLLIGFRMLQGLSAALIQSVVLAVAASAFPQSHRGRAMGFIGALGPLGAVTGPVPGGFLTTVWSWRVIFFINLPIGLLNLAFGMVVIAAYR